MSDKPQKSRYQENAKCLNNISSDMQILLARLDDSAILSIAGTEERDRVKTGSQLAKELCDDVTKIKQGDFSSMLVMLQGQAFALNKML